MPAGSVACSGGSDGPTAAKVDPCTTASFDSRAGIGFQLGCSSVTVSVSGITYDQFGRRTSYNYDMSCADGSNRKQGRVSNIAYNSIGEALTWDYTVNGASCQKR
jgi:hypothetical protein